MIILNCNPQQDLLLLYVLRSTPNKSFIVPIHHLYYAMDKGVEILLDELLIMRLDEVVGIDH